MLILTWTFLLIPDQQKVKIQVSICWALMFEKKRLLGDISSFQGWLRRGEKRFKIETSLKDCFFLLAQYNLKKYIFSHVFYISIALNKRSWYFHICLWTIYISKNLNISVFMNIDSSSKSQIYVLKSSENCLFDFLKCKPLFGQTRFH